MVLLLLLTTYYYYYLLLLTTTITTYYYYGQCTASPRKTWLSVIVVVVFSAITELSSLPQTRFSLFSPRSNVLIMKFNVSRPNVSSSSADSIRSLPPPSSSLMKSYLIFSSWSVLHSMSLPLQSFLPVLLLTVWPSMVASPTPPCP